MVASLLVQLHLMAGKEVPAAYKPLVLPVTDGQDLRFRRVSFEMGQAHSRVGQIVQDNQGFLWLGTNDGLQRFDSYTFRAFRHDPDNPNGLSGTNIYCLFKDRAGYLWIGSDKYLDRFDPATERFTHYPFSADVFEGWVSHITQDRHGILWLSTNHGLNRFDPATGRTERFQHVDGHPETLSSNSVRATLETREGLFWVSTAHSLDLFDRHSGKVVQRFELPARIAADRPHSEVSLCEDHRGVVWIAFSFADGLAAVEPHANKLTFYSYGAPSSDEAPLPGFRTIQEDTDGSLWLGSAGDGILKLDPQRHHLIRYRNNAWDPQSLSSDQIVSFLQDREGNIWAGTTGGGVTWFQPHPLPITRYRRQPTNPNSLETDYTSAVHQDRSGALWIGSMSVLTRIDSKTGKYTFYKKTGGPGQLSSTWVISIAEDPAGYLWFGTIDGGLDRYNPRTDTFKAFRRHPNDPGSLTDDTVLSLYIDHSGALWAGTENGLCRFDPKSGRFQSFKAPAGLRMRYRSIAEDQSGNLWLGTLEYGLRRLNMATGQFREYRQGRPSGLSSDQVNAVYVDHSGTIWAGTENGLNALNNATGVFTSYYTRDGLPSATINSILEDGAGNLWIGTSGGLARFNLLSKTFSNYHTSDGLLDDDFYNYASAYRAPSGQMFFNSYAGVISFFPARMTETLPESSPVITEFSLFGKPVPLKPGSPLTRSVSYTDAITLSHSQSIFSLEFSGLTYRSPEENRYRYRLEPLEMAWNEVDSAHRSAAYTTLAQGNYIFRLQARVNRGEWSGNTVLHIRVLPPWWNTWWFTLLVLASLLAALWLFYRARVRAMERRAMDLAGQLAERTAAEHEIKAISERMINAHEEERARIARELHDDLSQRIAALSISLSRQKAALKDQSRIKEIQSTIDYVSSLSEHVRRLSHELHPSLLQYGDLPTALRGFCAEISRLHNLAISFSSNGDFTRMPGRVMVCLYRITQEALRNVVKHSRASHAAVQLSHSDNEISLIISDTGVGFRFDQCHATDSLGLVSMKERVRLVNGRFNCWSEPNRGTVIRVSIPLPAHPGANEPKGEQLQTSGAV